MNFSSGFFFVENDFVCLGVNVKVMVEFSNFLLNFYLYRKNNAQNYVLASLILPVELLPYFEVVRVIKHSEKFDLYLDECNVGGYLSIYFR